MRIENTTLIPLNILDLNGTYTTFYSTTAIYIFLPRAHLIFTKTDHMNYKNLKTLKKIDIVQKTLHKHMELDTNNKNKASGVESKWWSRRMWNSAPVANTSKINTSTHGTILTEN